jgi:hypothetical protein
MNMNNLVKHYDQLTPEERFRLILAAGGRGDEAERDRLTKAGKHVTLTMQDHAPYAHAFDELALLTYIELQEEAARYAEAFVREGDASDLSDENDEGAEEIQDEEEPETLANEAVTEDEASELTAQQRMMDLVLASGYMLRTKTEGWKLFCERLNVPPFLLWKVLPGFDRLERYLAIAEKVAFYPEGFLRWMNRVRPEEEPELTEVPVTAEGLADAAETMYRERAKWWEG